MKRVRKITYLNCQLNLMIVRSILVAVERNKPRRSKGRTSCFIHRPTLQTLSNALLKSIKEQKKFFLMMLEYFRQCIKGKDMINSGKP